MTSSSTADIEFFFDPICPFAWVTSRWVEKVVAQSGYSVDWRFISLRILNKEKDYDTEFPAGYEHGHTAGLRMLRVAAAVRDELGSEPLGALYTAFGDSYFSVDQADGKAARAALGSIEAATACLATAGLDTKYAAAADDTSWDQLIEEETELALSRTGRDVGTPDHHLPAARRAVVLRTRDQPRARRRRRTSALGSSHYVGPFPRLRRDETQHARSATT